MQINIILLNLIYVIAGGFLTLFFMVLGYKIFDWITKFKACKELEDGNVAVGLVVLGYTLGVGIAMGLVIGMGLN